jgi:hypothetical protein
VESHEGNDKEGCFVRLIRRESRPDKEHVEKSPDEREREHRIENAFKNEAPLVGLASIENFFIFPDQK